MLRHRRELLDLRADAPNRAHNRLLLYQVSRGIALKLFADVLQEEVEQLPLLARRP
jgi:hypothetical protein